MDEAKEEYYGKRRLGEENTCDKCKITMFTENLIWITGEDFEPLPGEIVPENAYSKYDALCDACYESILIK